MALVCYYMQFEIERTVFSIDKICYNMKSTFPGIFVSLHYDISLHMVEKEKKPKQTTLFLQVFYISSLSIWLPPFIIFLLCLTISI